MGAEKSRVTAYAIASGVLIELGWDRLIHNASVGALLIAREFW